MNKALEKIKILLGIVKNKFGKVTTDKTEIFFDGDELTTETRVYDGEGNPIEDGEYTDDEKVYKIVDSVVTEIRPKETEETKVTEETETKTETTEETKTEMAEDETIIDEVTEEIKEQPAPMVTIDDRVSALEELVETLFNEIRQMKAREIEKTEKETEIIREFSAMKRSKTAESITKDNGEKCFADCNGSKSDRLKALKNKKN